MGASLNSNSEPQRAQDYLKGKTHEATDKTKDSLDPDTGKGTGSRGNQESASDLLNRYTDKAKSEVRALCQIHGEQHAGNDHAAEEILHYRWMPQRQTLESTLSRRSILRQTRRAARWILLETSCRATLAAPVVQALETQAMEANQLVRPWICSGTKRW